ncbi:hypothetical protein M407DRAFT_26828 [Tulasnella calospora MUT 4182]|uniref:Uncharacterized protein n=1 Tax=Tulasnella calospora MUT 4182 TaxID=1051891 RepID=A0A0C3QEY3_9AGAM|nr:hypothetical protein M407DRAFT_26828 [Tulasnella calospora MUT 4182]
MVYFLTNVTDKTLAFLYLLGHTRNQLADIYLAALAGPWAWTAEVLNILSGVADVVKTKVRPTSPPGPEPVPDHLLTLRISSRRRDISANATNVSVPRQRYHLSFRYGRTHCSAIHPPFDSTSSNQTIFKVIFSANLDATDDKDSTPAPVPNEPRRSSVALAAVVSGKKPQTRGKLGTSSVPFPSLPPSPGDDQPTPPQAGSIFSNLIRSNPALSPPVSGIVPRADRRGQVRRDVGGVSLPLRRSRKIALQGFDIVNQSEWRGRTLDEVAAVTARGRASATFPRIIDKGLLPPSLSSDDGKPASTISDYPTLTQSTPATSVELLHDHKRETGALTSNPGSTFEASNDAQALDAESAVRKVPMWETKETVGGFWDAVRLLDRFSSNRDRRRKLRWNVPERNAEEDWKWAKTEGKKPVGGRRLLVVSKPAPAPTAFISSQAVDDEWNDSGLFDEDT